MREGTKREPTYITPEHTGENEIKAAQFLLTQSLESYKQVAIDRYQIQHSIIRNYLWLSATLFFAECALMNRLLEQPLNACAGVLCVALLLSIIAIALGIEAMTGAYFLPAQSDYRYDFGYLIPKSGYDFNRHLMLIERMLHQSESSIDESMEAISKRQIRMRQMNKLLLLSLLFGFTAAGLFFTTAI